MLWKVLLRNSLVIQLSTLSDLRIGSTPGLSRLPLRMFCVGCLAHTKSIGRTFSMGPKGDGFGFQFPAG